MYQKIVVPLDGSELAECVFPHLESICNGCGTDEVVLLRVVPPAENIKMSGEFIPPSALDDKTIQTAEVKYAQGYLDQVKSKFNAKRAVVKTETVVGNPAEEIANYVRNSGADLVVIATHGRSGVSRWAFGSTADKLLRLVCTPVLMVRAPGCIPGF